jgi:hypothetical protein
MVPLAYDVKFVKGFQGVNAISGDVGEERHGSGVSFYPPLF